jgi:hypothetical protein
LTSLYNKTIFGLEDNDTFSQLGDRHVSRLGLVSRHTVTEHQAIGILHLVGRGDTAIVHAVVRTVEEESGDTLVALDSGSLFQTSGDVVGNLSEDGDLSLDNLLFSASRHVGADGLDESILRSIIEYLLPKLSGRVEVLRVDCRQERASVREEVTTVDLVEVDGSVSELDRIDGRQVVGSGALVEECHLAVSLEVAHSVGADRLVDRQLLVVRADSITRKVRRQ